VLFTPLVSRRSFKEHVVYITPFYRLCLFKPRCLLIDTTATPRARYYRHVTPQAKEGYATACRRYRPLFESRFSLFNIAALRRA